MFPGQIVSSGIYNTKKCVDLIFLSIDVSLRMKNDLCNMHEGSRVCVCVCVCVWMIYDLCELGVLVYVGVYG